MQHIFLLGLPDPITRPSADARRCHKLYQEKARVKPDNKGIDKRREFLYGSVRLCGMMWHYVRNLRMTPQ
jgi:hypothetical protein